MTKSRFGLMYVIFKNRRTHDRPTMTRRNIVKSYHDAKRLSFSFPSTLDPIALSGSSYPLCHASVIPRSGRSFASFPRSVARNARKRIADARVGPDDETRSRFNLHSHQRHGRDESNLFHAARGQW